MTQSNLAVSVVVPTFNRGDVITRAIESLLKQDFSLNYEIIVVDDGSTDDTKDKVCELQTLSSKIRLIEQDNAGASAARRTGIMAANADVVAFLDSDDISKPVHLSSLWEALNRDESVVLSYGLVEDMAGKLISDQNVPKVDKYGCLSTPQAALLRNGCFTFSMNLMTYKSLAIIATENRQHVLAANDYDLCLRLSVKGRFAFADITTIQIERREDGIGSQLGDKQVGFAVIVAEESYKLSVVKNKYLKDAFKHRVQLLWPTAFAQLWANKNFSLALRVGWIGIRNCTAVNFKTLYWAIDHYCIHKKK